MNYTEYLEKLREIIKDFTKNNNISNEQEKTLQEIENILVNHSLYLGNDLFSDLDTLYKEYTEFFVRRYFSQILQLVGNQANPDQIITFSQQIADRLWAIYDFRGNVLSDNSLIEHTKNLAYFRSFFSSINEDTSLNTKEFTGFVSRTIIWFLNYSLTNRVKQNSPSSEIEYSLKLAEKIREIFENHTPNYEQKLEGFIKQYDACMLYFYEAGYTIQAYKNNPVKYSLLLFQLQFLLTMKVLKQKIDSFQTISQANIEEYNKALDRLVEFIESKAYLQSQYNTNSHREMILQSISDAIAVNYSMLGIQLALNPNYHDAYPYHEKAEILYKYLTEPLSNIKTDEAEFSRWLHKLETTKRGAIRHAHRSCSAIMPRSETLDERHVDNAIDPLLDEANFRLSEYMKIAYRLISLSNNTQNQNHQTINELYIRLLSEDKFLRIWREHLNAETENSRDRYEFYMQYTHADFLMRYLQLDTDENIIKLSHDIEMINSELDYLETNEEPAETFAETVIYEVENLTLYKKFLQNNNITDSEILKEFSKAQACAEKLFIKSCTLSEEHFEESDGHITINYIYSYYFINYNEVHYITGVFLKAIQNYQNGETTLQKLAQEFKDAINKYANLKKELRIKYKLLPLFEEVRDYLEKEIEETNANPLLLTSLDSEFSEVQSLAISDEVSDWLAEKNSSSSTQSSDNQNIVQLGSNPAKETKDQAPEDDQKPQAKIIAFPKSPKGPQSSLASHQKSFKKTLTQAIQLCNLDHAPNADQIAERYFQIMHLVKTLKKDYKLTRKQEKKLLDFLLQPGKKNNIDKLIKHLRLIASDEKLSKKYNFTAFSSPKTKPQETPANELQEKPSTNVGDPITELTPGQYPEKQTTDTPSHISTPKDREPKEYHEDRIAIGDPSHDDQATSLTSFSSDKTGFDSFSPTIPDEVDLDECLTMENFGPLVHLLENLKHQHLSKPALVSQNNLAKQLLDRYSKMPEWQKAFSLQTLITQAKLSEGHGYAIVTGSDGKASILEYKGNPPTNSSQNHTATNQQQSFKKPHLKRPLFDKKAFKEFLKAHPVGTEAAVYGTAQKAILLLCAYEVMVYTKALLDEARGVKNKISGQEAAIGLATIAVISYGISVLGSAFPRLTGALMTAALAYTTYNFLQKSKTHDYSDTHVYSPHTKGLVSKELAAQIAEFEKEKTIKQATKLLESVHRVIGFKMTKNLEIVAKLDDKIYYQVKAVYDVNSVHYKSATNQVISLPKITSPGFGAPVAFKNIILIDRYGKKTIYKRHFVTPQNELVASNLDAKTQWASIINDPDTDFYSNFDDEAAVMGYLKTDDLSEDLVFDIKANRVYSDRDFFKGTLELTKDQKLIYHSIGMSTGAISLKALLKATKKAAKSLCKQNKQLVIHSDLYKQGQLFKHKINDAEYGKKIIPILIKEVNNLYYQGKIDQEAYNFVRFLKDYQSAQVVQVAHALAKHTDNKMIDKFSEFYKSTSIDVTHKTDKTKINLSRHSHLDHLLKQLH